MEVVIISNDLFKENSPIKDDTITTKFVPYVNLAQKIYIEPILGRPLTDELKSQIKAATQPGATGDEITPENQALIEIIAPALSFYTVYQGLPSHWMAIVNKGVTLRSSENSQAITMEDMGQFRRWMKDDAERLQRDLIQYLQRCRSSYPLWNPEQGCGCSMDQGSGSAKESFDTGIYIPKKR